MVLKFKGDKFLAEGGFASRYHQAQDKPVEVGGTLHKLQQQSMRLQNLKLSNETQISTLVKVIRQLKIQQYYLCYKQWHYLVFQKCDPLGDQMNI